MNDHCLARGTGLLRVLDYILANPINGYNHTLVYLEQSMVDDSLLRLCPRSN